MNYDLLLTTDHSRCLQKERTFDVYSICLDRGMRHYPTVSVLCGDYKQEVSVSVSLDCGLCSSTRTESEVIRCVSSTYRAN